MGVITYFLLTLIFIYESKTEIVLKISYIIRLRNYLLSHPACPAVALPRERQAVSSSIYLYI